MFRKILMLTATLALAVSVNAQDEKKSAKITGFLIDNMCATPNDSHAKSHAVSCARMEACEKSGYAVVSKDKIYKLDAEGNRRALAIIKETKTKKGLAVEAEGTVEGDTLHVDDMTEVQ